MMAGGIQKSYFMLSRSASPCLIPCSRSIEFRPGFDCSTSDQRFSPSEDRRAILPHPRILEVRAAEFLQF